MIVKLFGGPLPVVPRVAQEYIPKVNARSQTLDLLARGSKCYNLGRSVPDG
jgi:hypothetical protein